MFSVEKYDSPSASSGLCFHCRASKRPGEGIIDLGRDINEERGAVQICASCFDEGARISGAQSKQTRALEEKIARLTERLDEALIRADAAETALDALRRYDLVGTPVPAMAEPK